MSIKKLPIQKEKINPQGIEKVMWDAIVIGTGMGGSTVGYCLGKSGYKVLFVESGDFNRAGSADNQLGSRPGYWPSEIAVRINGIAKEMLLPLGQGPGGSTALYAAQLERMFRSDFEGSTEHSSRWPIEYSDFEKYYAQAESLYKVRGSSDIFNPNNNLADPLKMSSSDERIFTEFSSLGMAPFRSHIAIDGVDGCTGCGGVICTKSCKNDAMKICLQPALGQYECFLLTSAIVTKINANDEKVLSVECQHDGKKIVLTAKFYILAAGAIFTPQILLSSANIFWPNGVANSSGLVGKNLMFHLSDFYILKPRSGAVISKPGKSISSNFLYEIKNEKYGTFQSVGIPVNTQYFYKFLSGVLQRNIVLKNIPSIFIILLSRILTFIFRKYSIFASIIEDYPEESNRVFINDNNKIEIQYSISDNTHRRNQYFRSHLIKLLNQSFNVLSTKSKRNVNYGHPMGTCKLGDSNLDSVVNRNNQSHDLSNLFICDASFFPTSSGVNPSLTIAANSIRVAEYIAIDSEFKISQIKTF